MSQGTLDLPDDDFDPERALLETAGLRDAAELRKWPERLLEIADVFEAELARMAAASLDARGTAERLALALARNQGGRPVYLPTGERLEGVLRARRIYHRVGRPDGHGGRLSIEQLARDEGICVQQAYKDYAEIRAIERARQQPKLL